MTMQMPKWKTFTLESYEIPHIYREPSKAIFTTKRDKITEADVQWMTRPDGQYSDPTRINEAIQVYPRGVDPVSKVKYGTNPYKLEVIRIPEVPAEQNVAISRPRLHQNIFVNTNPGVRASASAVDVNTKIDMSNIKKITSKEKVLSLVNPVSSYRIDSIDPAIFRLDYNNKALDKDTDYYSVMANRIMKVQTNDNRDAENIKNITDKIHAQNVNATTSSYKTNANNESYTADKIADRAFAYNVNAAMSSYKTNANNESYTADKISERPYVEGVNAKMSSVRYTGGNNGEFIQDKIGDNNLRVMNIQASYSKPTTQVVVPDMNLLSKQELQKIISKQIFRKDDNMNAMDAGVTLQMKQSQGETNSVKTLKELQTPVMNTDVPTVNKIVKEAMPVSRTMSTLPNMDVRQEDFTMKENNKRNLAFRMQMYNPELF